MDVCTRGGELRLCMATLYLGSLVGCRGVLNVVHGAHDTVNRILDHPDIRAIAFVGSDAAGRYIYQRGCANGKRVQVSNIVGGIPILNTT